jgi:LacI family transcriptional regulator
MSDVTIKDIAEATGVSYATVSRTLNNRSGVNAATREKILQAAKDLGYRPNIHARSLKTNQTFTLALIVPDISNPFFSDIALAVNKTAYQYGYNTILCSTNWDPEIEKAQLKLIQDQRVDGIIFKPADRSPDLYLDLNIPTVMISNLVANGLSFIEVDNFKGGKDTAQHLIQCGYKKFSFIGGAKESRSNSDRLEGYRKTLEKHGYQLSEEKIRFGPFTIESGYQIIKSLMETNDPPDCAFCGNDLIALGVFQYLVETGVSVPEKFGLVGFDDVYFASLPQIQMTTVAQPRSQMGSMAVNTLIKRIENGSSSFVEHILLEPKLIIRKSTRNYS